MWRNRYYPDFSTMDPTLARFLPYVRRVVPAPTGNVGALGLGIALVVGWLIRA